MKELFQLHARRKVKNTLEVRNGLNVTSTLNLPLQSNVQVWGESGRWKGPFRLFAIDGQTCT